MQIGNEASRRARRLLAFGFSFAPKVLGAALSFLFLLVLARISSSVTYGLAALAITLSSLVAPISSLGQRVVLLSRLSRLDETRSSRAASAISQAWRIGFASCLSLGLLVGFGSATTNKLSSSLLSAIMIGALVSAQGIVDLTSQTLRALGRTDLSIYLREVAPRCVAIAAVTLLSAICGPINSAAAIFSLAGGFAASAFFLVSTAVTMVPKLTNHVFRSSTLLYLKLGMQRLPHMALATARENVDTLIVGVTAGASNAALYFTLIKFSNLLTLPAASISAKTVVDATRLYGARREREAVERVFNTFKLTAVLVVPAAIAVSICSPLLLSAFKLTSSGRLILIGLVFLNGAIQATFSSLWEFMQCLPISKHFNMVFAATVIGGSIAMFATGSLFGTVGVAAAYLALNLLWILFGLRSVHRWARETHKRHPV